MSINEIIIYIMVIFMAIGAIDRIFGNKLGLGAQFEEGITAIGALALSMVGIIALAPVIPASPSGLVRIRTPEASQFGFTSFFRI